ncbi:MAG: hypothetical protein QHH75_08945 [Bacillota bacterium]|nr:hypothetical protein [Bacillota bacterium]
MVNFGDRFNQFLLERKAEAADETLKGEQYKEFVERYGLLRAQLVASIAEDLQDLLIQLEDCKNEQGAYENEVIYKIGFMDGVQFGQGVIIEEAGQVIKGVTGCVQLQADEEEDKKVWEMRNAS